MCVVPAVNCGWRALQQRKLTLTHFIGLNPHHSLKVVIFMWMRCAEVHLVNNWIHSCCFQHLFWVQLSTSGHLGEVSPQPSRLPCPSRVSENQKDTSTTFSQDVSGSVSPSDSFWLHNKIWIYCCSLDKKTLLDLAFIENNPCFYLQKFKTLFKTARRLTSFTLSENNKNHLSGSVSEGGVAEIGRCKCH